MLQGRRVVRSRVMLLAAGDLLLLVVAYSLAFWLRFSIAFPGTQGFLPRSRFLEVDHLYWILAGSQVLLPYCLGLYDRLGSHRAGQWVKLCFAAVALQILFLVGFRYFTSPWSTPLPESALYFPRSVYLLFLPLNATGLILWRGWFLNWIASRQEASRIAIVGSGVAAARLVKEIRALGDRRLEIVGIFTESPSDDEAKIEGIPVLGNRAEILDLAPRHAINELIIASEGSWQGRLLETIARGGSTTARVWIVPGFYELMIAKVQRLSVREIPLVELPREPAARPYILLKRLVDLALALGLAVLLAPVAVAGGVAVWLQDRGPILYRQKRVGQEFQQFWLYKLRTMSPDAENGTGPVLCQSDDPRVTPVGRWLRRYRIDELPQLWNVLRGEMSLVGPRPERPFFVEQHLVEFPTYGERFKVKPGVSGLAQVRGNYETTPVNKLRYDLAYIYNQSLWLDLSILLDTIKEVVSSRGR